MTSTQQGYLVLADISGYTSYLAGTELDHSQAILTELLELVIERFETHLTIAKLEGDAVFAYAPAERIQRGETLLELIELTYVAFVDRRDIAYGRTIAQYPHRGFGMVGKHRAVQVVIPGGRGL